MVKVLDCTIRDGGYSDNWEYSDEYVLDLITDLNKKNIDFAEIGM